MALDTLQLSPTIINTDKLVQAAGNLMAKEKAEETARQKAMSDQLSKIDSAKLRKADIGEFRKLYDDVLTYGAQNSNRMNDIEVQTELNRKMNTLRGFAEFSARNKEEYDIPLLRRKFDPDLDPNAGSYIEEVINTPSSKLGSIDLSRISNVDKKDYMSEVFKGFNPNVEKEIGSTTYKNTKEVYGEILKKVDDYVASSLSTPTGEKAFRQFAASYAQRNNIDLNTLDGRKKAIEGFSDAIFNNFIGKSDASIKQDEAKTPSQFDIDYSLGFKARNANQYNERLNNIQRLFDGDKAAADEVLLFLPAGAKISNSANSDILELSYTENVKNADGTVSAVPRKLVFDKKNPESFARGINSLYSQLGGARGWDKIDNEEIISFAKAAKWSPKPPVRVKAASKGSAGEQFAPTTTVKGTDLSDIFKK